ncbi:hypothetical protein FQA47_012179 [Oryzias melastigma]|uniref:Uncharacterized protein n=1 Tax=Oryzias melastigma TaxID=30732 RepID=A0A834KVR7_ORYME|nr:hypothetical protein FQA47_012179 [Oryzias melastigma]
MERWKRPAHRGFDPSVIAAPGNSRAHRSFTADWIDSSVRRTHAHTLQAYCSSMLHALLPPKVLPSVSPSPLYSRSQRSVLYQLCAGVDRREEMRETEGVGGRER